MGSCKGLQYGYGWGVNCHRKLLQNVVLKTVTIIFFYLFYKKKLKICDLDYSCRAGPKNEKKTGGGGGGLGAALG